MSNVESNSIVVDASYEKFITDLATTSSEQTFTNSSAAHALAIVRTIFKNSKSNICMFTGKLDLIYEDGELLSNLREFIDGHNGNLKILIQEEGFVDGDNVFLRTALGCKNAANVIVKKAAGNKLSGIKKHFLVADDRSYRVETDVNSKTAIGCFNDRGVAQKLNTAFNEMFENSADAFSCNPV